MKLQLSHSLLSVFALSATTKMVSATNLNEFCIDNEGDLRNAIALAKPRDEILLCKNSVIYLSSPIKVDNVDARILCQNQDNCKIIGRDTTQLFEGAPKYLSWDTVFFQNDARALFSNLRSTGACHNYNGGAVHFDGCTFSKCQTSSSGGAIAAKATTLSLVESYFDDNAAGTDGGAVSATSGSQLVFIKTDFNKNRAGRDGGAVFVENSTASFTTCVMELNTAQESGGAIYDEGESVVFVSDSRLTRNKAVKSNGGAMFLEKTTVSISDSYLDYNTAKSQGGAIYDKEGSKVGASSSYFEYNEAEDFDAGALNANGTFAHFWKCKINHNIAGRDGGAIDDDDTARSVLSFAASDCHENDAGASGGCMEWDDTYAVVFETAFIGNRARQNGGAIVANDEVHAAIKKSTFKSNVARQGDDLFLRDDDNTFVKCDADTFFCNGHSGGGIVDEGRQDNTNCDDVAQAFSSSVCDSY